MYQIQQYLLNGYQRKQIYDTAHKRGLGDYFTLGTSLYSNGRTSKASPLGSDDSSLPEINIKDDHSCSIQKVTREAPDCDTAVSFPASLRLSVQSIN